MTSANITSCTFTAIPGVFEKGAPEACNQKQDKTKQEIYKRRWTPKSSSKPHCIHEAGGGRAQPREVCWADAPTCTRPRRSAGAEVSPDRSATFPQGEAGTPGVQGYQPDCAASLRCERAGRRWGIISQHQVYKPASQKRGAHY